jgi:hypothetical protein
VPGCAATAHFAISDAVGYRVLNPCNPWIRQIKDRRVGHLDPEKRSRVPFLPKCRQTCVNNLSPCRERLIAFSSTGRGAENRFESETALALQFARGGLLSNHRL